MAKRKATVNNIIYELDNEDIELSSDEEVKEPKISRFEADTTPSFAQTEIIIEESSTDIINIDEDIKNTQSENLENGGKTLEEIKDVSINSELAEVNNCEENKINTDTIYNEDIEVDSPVSNEIVAGCENRIPLVSVRFQNQKIAKAYKKKLKEFMLNLIKLHDKDIDSEYDDTDLELDVWPEDCEQNIAENVTEIEENLFFVDTDPCNDAQSEIPRYQEVSKVMTNLPEETPEPPLRKRGATCFNCGGGHQLRECPLPRNNAKIAENRRQKGAAKVGRYHIEDDQKYGHLIPGRISGQLRHALCLKRHELPLYIYRMRLLGYPPGWLEDARISHSGITMFDSGGNAVLDPEEEDGELCEQGSKDKFDIKKILDFPGFNVPASSRYKEEAHLYGLPPISEQDSKMAMLQMLAPNAMKAYKRKKLIMFPSSSTNTTLEGQAEMEIDSGEDAVEFPSIPPLPDDEPPPPLPPPPPPPPESPEPEVDRKSNLQELKETSVDIKNPATDQKIAKTDLIKENADKKKDDSVDDDLEIVYVVKLSDIPIPDDQIIISDEEDVLQISSGRESPSLDDLENKKKLLLDALEGGNKHDENVDETIDITAVEEKEITEGNLKDDGDKVDKQEHTHSADEVNDKATESQETVATDTADVSQISEERVEFDSTSQDDVIVVSESESDVTTTPDRRSRGGVKTTEYGTPVLNIASEFLKLPSDNNFAKDICDVINFENLPNSTGKYKQISTLLKKVKDEVDRIQSS